VDSGLSVDFLKNMKSTGLTHLTAVSGANCAIVIGAFWLIARFFKLGRNLRFVVMSFALAGYVALVGPQPSVLRASFMMLAVAFALEFGRRVWLPAALILGSAILLIADPWLIGDYGFWLSVLATFGLVILTPRLTEYFREKIPEFLAIGLAATIAAQLWCLPLLVELQGGLTTYSVLANLLVEPVVPVITLLGLASTLVGVIFPFGGAFLLNLAQVPAHWIVFVANSLANLPGGLVSLPDGLLGGLVLGVFVALVSFAISKRNYLAGSAAGLLFAIWVGSQTIQLTHQAAWPVAGWTIVNCDVGQGDALVLKSKNQIAVIDVGKEPEPIDQCLDRLGVERINLLVLTHFDFDHVGGLSGAEKGRSIDTALVSPFNDPRPEAKRLVNQLQHSVGQVVLGKQGASGMLGDFSWNIISSLESQATTANQASLGMRFEDSNMVLYTLADLDEIAQSAAMQSVTASNKSTIVKVSHHGSADQSAQLYQAIDPDLALISVGKGNPYGHPTARILDILKSIGTRVFRTDLQGGISLRVGDSGIEAIVTGAR
jgi:competence protein ComEC